MRNTYGGLLQILVKEAALLQINSSNANARIVSPLIKVLEAHNLTPIRLEAKEGLCLINGTQLITSLGAEAVERAGIIARQADVVAALTLEVLKGTSKAFDPGKKQADMTGTGFRLN